MLSVELLVIEVNKYWPNLELIKDNMMREERVRATNMKATLFTNINNLILVVDKVIKMELFQSADFSYLVPEKCKNKVKLSLRE